MLRHIRTYALFFVLLFFPGAYGLELEKVTPSLQYLYNYYYDPGALKAKSDSSYSIKDEDAQRVAKSLDSLPPEEITLDTEVNDLALYFVENVPYIQTRMAYNGDTNDLQSLGVMTGAYHGGIITVRFPLSILPQIVSLSTVEFIYDEAKLEYESGSEFIGPVWKKPPPLEKDSVSK